MEGFVAFDNVHIMWLISIILFVALNGWLYFHLKPRNQLVWQKIVFWTLLITEIWKQIYLVITNQYSYWSPPFHLCGLGIFIIGIHVYTKNITTATLLFSLTLPGALIALIFPGWANEPVGSFLHIHSFVFHALLLVYVVVLLFVKQLEIKVNELWRSMIFLFIFVPMIYYYNLTFGTNFMFLNKPVKNTPLQWLYNSFGKEGYIFSLIASLLVVWIVQYSLYYFLHKRKK